MTASTRLPVALRRAPDYEPDRLNSALDALMADLGGWERWVRPGHRVLLKPNLLNGARPEACCTTHPALVEAVARRLLDLGAHPRIGDSPAFGWVRQICTGNGIAEVADRLGVPLVDFVRPVKVPSVRPDVLSHFYVDEEVLEADVVINLPKLKSHRQLCFTAAVKNLYGCMPGKRKAYWHMARGRQDLDFAQLVASFAYTVAPHLNIIDGVMAMERDGPQGGDPRSLGVLIASPDPAAADSVVEALIRPPADDSLLLNACRRLNLGAPDLARTDLLGDPLEACAVSDFVHPWLMGVAFSPVRLARSAWRNFVITRLSGNRTAASS